MKDLELELEMLCLKLLQSYATLAQLYNMVVLRTQSHYARRFVEALYELYASSVNILYGYALKPCCERFSSANYCNVFLWTSLERGYEFPEHNQEAKVAHKLNEHRNSI